MSGHPRQRQTHLGPGGRLFNMPISCYLGPLGGSQLEDRIRSGTLDGLVGFLDKYAKDPEFNSVTIMAIWP
jgi:hypothetical protein